MIDLSPMKRIAVDVTARTFRVGAGSRGEVSDALQPYELGATGGFVSVTGVSGLTLGGGLAGCYANMALRSTTFFPQRSFSQTGGLSQPAPLNMTISSGEFEAAAATSGSSPA